MVRHFLIESTPKGVQIKGCPEEPVFSSLAALVYQHSLTRISLPTRLVVPSHELEGGSNRTDSELLKIYENGAMCQLLYFTTKDVESLTGPNAIKKVVDELFESINEKHLHPSPVHFKASTKGITLTDNSHRLVLSVNHATNLSLSICRSKIILPSALPFEWYQLHSIWSWTANFFLSER